MKKQIHIYMTMELFRRTRRYAKKKGMSIGAVVRKSLGFYLDENE